jgi:hypothetical protein
MMDGSHSHLEDVALAQAPPLLLPAPATASELFQGPRREDMFGGEEGVRRGTRFTEAETLRIKALIKERLLYAASQLSAEAASELEKVDLTQYHTVSERYDHARMLAKSGRILSGEAVEEIKRMSFFDYVREAFGPFYLADEDQVGHEQICIRLVRPQRRSDVGSLHADYWFWEHYGWPVPTGENRTKMWTGIEVDAPRNGLMLAPGSHRSGWGYRTEDQGGKIAFVSEFDWREIGLKRFIGEPGEPVLFNYRTLHIGSLNLAEVCRVSIETTIMYRES